MLPVSLLSLYLVIPTLATPLSTNHRYDVPQGSPFVLAPVLTEEHQAPYGLINNSYIVVFKKDTPQAIVDNHYNFFQAAHSEYPLLDDESGIRHVYDSHIKGYAGRFTDTVLQRIRKRAEVDYVERDQIVRTQEIQEGAPWGLARISHRPKLSSDTSNNSKYKFDVHGGEGVDVYVIDTGIHINHAEFEGRASWGKSFPRNEVDEDNDGHGTHCAGTIASGKYGVAKAANVIAVKVLKSHGKGAMSAAIAGVLYAADAAEAKAMRAAAEVKATGKTKHKGSVANMSLVGGKCITLDRAVNSAVGTGLHFVVAAGNDHSDACNYSPAATEDAITVGASTHRDERADISNSGRCVDVFAPGVDILSTWIGSKDATHKLNGTSMASAHTAGLLAYFISIYPSTTFNPGPPGSTSSLLPPELNPQRPTTSSFTRLYQSIYNIMPLWVGGLLPSPRFVHAITSPPEFNPLSPENLKATLIQLSSRNMLSEIPANTVNLLIFNNYTVSPSVSY
ncbi:peptidase S8/S53 domain-containing protein [Lactarius quietus]|nr:peptidase S8/S53 domain-containing protein [Lactarius quietus]